MCHALQSSEAPDAGAAPRLKTPRARESQSSRGVLLDGIQAALYDTMLDLPSSLTPCVRLAIENRRTLTFVETKWDNRGLWQDHAGYSTTQPFPLGTEFAKCLFTGAYSADTWALRPGIPHHNDLAVDQPDSALVHAPPILSRKHPFAFPGVWKQQYDLRYRRAIAHLRSAVQRAMDHDSTPFLGSGNPLPDILKPPPWTLTGNTFAGAVAYVVRGTDGRPANIT